MQHLQTAEEIRPLLVAANDPTSLLLCKASHKLLHHLRHPKTCNSVSIAQSMLKEVLRHCKCLEVFHNQFTDLHDTMTWKGVCAKYTNPGSLDIHSKNHIHLRGLYLISDITNTTASFKSGFEKTQHILPQWLFEIQCNISISDPLLIQFTRFLIRYICPTPPSTQIWMHKKCDIHHSPHLQRTLVVARCCYGWYSDTMVHISLGCDLRKRGRCFFRVLIPTE